MDISYLTDSPGLFFLGKIKNTVNLRKVVAPINWFLFESIQQVDYAVPGSLLMILLNLRNNSVFEDRKILDIASTEINRRLKKNDNLMRCSHLLIVVER